MTVIMCLGFVTSLTNVFPGHVHQKKEEPAKHLTNAIGMKFVWIPSGSFIMGSPNDEKQRRDNELQHKVRLTKGFYLAVHVVTQEQWHEVMGNNPSIFKGEKHLPVENVSWHDCQMFLEALRKKDKQMYRLPTEAEWEYSCRAGKTTSYCFGDDKGVLGQFAWYIENSQRKTHPVGEKNPNEWGLFDMHGNVYQWCEDWFDNYSKEDIVDPKGPDKGTRRVIRGGSWSNSPEYCRSAFRGRYAPSNRHDYIGFRVCFCLE